jgi:hypothetical protein
MSPVVSCLVASLDRAFDRRSWHGTNLRGALRGLSREVLLWRPGGPRNNIWELALHAAYWKYAVRRRLTGDKRGSFALVGSNFWRRSASTSIDRWDQDLALLVSEHAALRQAVIEFPQSRLVDRPARSVFTYEALVHGAAAHDLYHAGQIQLLKRLVRSSR